MLGRAHVRLFGLGGCTSGRLVRASGGCRRGWARDRNHRCRSERRSAAVDRSARAAGAGYRVQAGHRPVFEFLGMGARSSHSCRRLERSMADALADSLPDDHDVATRAARKDPRSHCRSYLIHGRSPPPFAQPEPVEKPSQITTTGDYAWPGTWTLERDEADRTEHRHLARDLRPAFSVGFIRSSRTARLPCGRRPSGGFRRRGRRRKRRDSWRIASCTYRGHLRFTQRCDDFSLHLYPRAAARRVNRAYSQLARGHSARPAMKQKADILGPAAAGSSTPTPSSPSSTLPLRPIGMRPGALLWPHCSRGKQIGPR